MKSLKSWKSIAVTVVLPLVITLIVTLQPAVTFACSTVSHCGG